MASSGSLDMIVVWEWFMQGVWRPYDSLITNFIEKFRNQATRINLGAVDQKLVMYDIDFRLQTQIRHGTGTSRPIRRQLYPREHPAGKGTIWQWEADQPGNWQMFDMITLALVESAYMQGHPALDLSKLPQAQGSMPYILDLTKMKQVRIETGNMRNIRRSTLSFFYPMTSATSMMTSVAPSLHLPQSSPMGLAASQTLPMSLSQQTLPSQISLQNLQQPMPAHLQHQHLLQQQMLQQQKMQQQKMQQQKMQQAQQLQSSPAPQSQQPSPQLIPSPQPQHHQQPQSRQRQPSPQLHHHSQQQQQQRQQYSMSGLEQHSPQAQLHQQQLQQTQPSPIQQQQPPPFQQQHPQHQMSHMEQQSQQNLMLHQQQQIQQQIQHQQQQQQQRPLSRQQEPSSPYAQQQQQRPLSRQQEPPSPLHYQQQQQRPQSRQEPPSPQQRPLSRQEPPSPLQRPLSRQEPPSPLQRPLSRQHEPPSPLNYQQPQRPHSRQEPPSPLHPHHHQQQHALSRQQEHPSTLHHQQQQQRQDPSPQPYSQHQQRPLSRQEPSPQPYSQHQQRPLSRQEPSPQPHLQQQQRPQSVQDLSPQPYLQQQQRPQSRQDLSPQPYLQQQQQQQQRPLSRQEASPQPYLQQQQQQQQPPLSRREPSPQPYLQQQQRPQSRQDPSPQPHLQHQQQRPLSRQHENSQQQYLQQQQQHQHQRETSPHPQHQLLTGHQAQQQYPLPHQEQLSMLHPQFQYQQQHQQQHQQSQISQQQHQHLQQQVPPQQKPPAQNLVKTPKPQPRPHQPNPIRPTASQQKIAVPAPIPKIPPGLANLGAQHSVALSMAMNANPALSGVVPCLPGLTAAINQNGLTSKSTKRALTKSSSLPSNSESQTSSALSSSLPPHSEFLASALDAKLTKKLKMNNIGHKVPSASAVMSTSAFQHSSGAILHPQPHPVSSLLPSVAGQFVNPHLHPSHQHHPYHNSYMIPTIPSAADHQLPRTSGLNLSAGPSAITTLTSSADHQLPRPPGLNLSAGLSAIRAQSNGSVPRKTITAGPPMISHITQSQQKTHPQPLPGQHLLTDPQSSVITCSGSISRPSSALNSQISHPGAALQMASLIQQQHRQMQPQRPLIPQHALSGSHIAMGPQAQIPLPHQISLQQRHPHQPPHHISHYPGYTNGGLGHLANGAPLFHMSGAGHPSLANSSVPITQGSNMKTIGRLLSPVVSNITNILMSPAIPVRLPTQMHPSNSIASGHQNHGRIPLTKSTSKLRHSAEDVLKNYMTTVDQPPTEEDCCICCEKVDQPSGYGDGKDKVCVKLKRCGHFFHRLCLFAMYNNGHKDGSIQCPTCKTIYGKKLGNCPDGEMDYMTIVESLPGHTDCGTIRILYDIKPSIQGPEHPNPGKRFTTKGFPRCCYLPDNEKGRKVLRLLIKAWKRRLIFTIGTSTTTGEPNTVTWNEIHHKTELYTNYTGHGYPDPNYLENVLLELAAQGVTDDGDDDDDDDNSNVKAGSVPSGPEAGSGIELTANK